MFKKFVVLVGLLALTIPATARADASMLRQSVEVTNETKNLTGTNVIAAKEDFIALAFTNTNSGTLPQLGYVPSVDLSGVLPLVDVVDAGGGVVTGNTLSFSAFDIAPGTSITKTIRVRVKYYLPPYSFVLKATYGNVAQISIQSPTGATPTYVAPNAGAENTLWVLVLALVLLGLVYGLLNRRARKFIFS